MGSAASTETVAASPEKKKRTSVCGTETARERILALVTHHQGPEESDLIRLLRLSGLGSTVEDLGAILRMLVSHYAIKEVPNRERAADKVLPGYIAGKGADVEDEAVEDANAG